MKKLLIFDLDGTLINTLSDLTNAVNFALSSFNFETKDEDYVRKAIGNGVAVLMSRCMEGGFDNPSYEKALKTFKEYYTKNYYEHSYPYPHMLEALQELKRLGFKLAVVTNKVDRIAKDLINHYFPNIFEMIQGDDPKFLKKPSPQMVEHVINSLNFKKEDCCYIGDTNVDYDTAINSNIDVLLVTYGFRNEEEMKKYGYTCDRISSPDQLVSYFITPR